MIFALYSGISRPLCLPGIWFFRPPQPSDLKGPVGDGFQHEPVQVNSVLRVVLYTRRAEIFPQEPIATWAGRSMQHYKYHQPTHCRRCLSIFFGPAAYPTQQIIADDPFLGKFCTRVSSGHGWCQDNPSFFDHPCAHLPPQVVYLIFTFLGVVGWKDSSDPGFCSHWCSFTGLARNLPEKG
jgi:hypothetical protein